jgi:hypothetical protein
LHIRRVEDACAPPREARNALGCIAVDLAEHRACTARIQLVCCVLEQLASDAAFACGRRDDHVRDEAAVTARIEFVRDASDDLVTLEDEPRIEVVAVVREPVLERFALCGECIEVDAAMKASEQLWIGLDQMSSSGGAIGRLPRERRCSAR